MSELRNNIKIRITFKIHSGLSLNDMIKQCQIMLRLQSHPVGIVR